MVISHLLQEKGLIKISEGIDLESVLHVPKLTCNLSCLLANYLEILIVVLSSMNPIVFFRTRARGRRLAVLG